MFFIFFYVISLFLWKKNVLFRSQGGNAENEHLILGGEAAMWTEQVDGEAVVHKLWPRASALAERLWSDLETDWKQAEIR